jgi:hypothetical protein
LGNCLHSPSTCTFSIGTWLAVSLIFEFLPLLLTVVRQVVGNAPNHHTAIETHQQNEDLHG